MTPTADDRTLAGLSRAASRGEMRVGDYVGEHWETPSGFEAVLYHNHSISDYVAVFVGTNDRRDILVDLRHAFGVETKHYSDAMEFAKHAMETSNETARFVGHSLGGSLAMAAQAKYGSTAVTFNSAGLNSKAVSGSVPTPGAVRNFYSAFDILQPVILLAPSRIYGPSISVGPAGFHGIKAMADGM